MPITHIDRDVCRELQARAAAALAREFENDGIVVRCEGGTYAPTHLKSKFTFSVRSEGGEVITPEARNFSLYCTTFGLQPGDQNKYFVSQGRKFKLVGIAPRSWKRPLIATLVQTGQTFKFSRIDRGQLTES